VDIAPNRLSIIVQRVKEAKVVFDNKQQLLCWNVRGSNPGGGKIFRTCPDRPWGPPRILYDGYWVFPWGKERPGRDVHHLSPSSVEALEE
jgi:hypothetical protein